MAQVASTNSRCRVVRQLPLVIMIASGLKCGAGLADNPGATFLIETGWSRSGSTSYSYGQDGTAP